MLRDTISAFVMDMLCSLNNNKHKKYCKHQAKTQTCIHQARMDQFDRRPYPQDGGSGQCPEVDSLMESGFDLAGKLYMFTTSRQQFQWAHSTQGYQHGSIVIVII